MTKFVEFQGARMIEGWPEKIIAAQSVTTYRLDGADYARIPYGEEKDDWGAGDHPCRDCRVVKGQLHVSGCDAEECPKCGHQFLGCDCDE